MTKKEIIEFIESRYSDEEQLLWQVVSSNDVYEHYAMDIDKWNEFVAREERVASLADGYTESVLDAWSYIADEKAE